MATTLKKLTDVLDLPPEVVMDMARINMVGNMELIVENHKGLIEYSPECIRVRVKAGEVVVTGKNLHLRFLYKDEVKIAGVLENVELR